MTPAIYLTQWLIICFSKVIRWSWKSPYTGKFSINTLELKPVLNISKAILWKSSRELIPSWMNFPREKITSSFGDVKIALNLSSYGRISKLDIFSSKTELKVSLALVWNSHVIWKCSSLSKLCELQKLHSRCSTGRRGSWCRPSFKRQKLNVSLQTIFFFKYGIGS